MTATTAITTGGRDQRPRLPLASLALAGAALTVSLVAITAHDDAPAQPPAAPVASSSGSGSGTGDCFTRAVIVRC